MTKTKMRTKEDAMEHLRRFADEDPGNGGSIAYTATDLVEQADRLLEYGRWFDFRPFSGRDVRALTIMRDWMIATIHDKKCDGNLDDESLLYTELRREIENIGGLQEEEKNENDQR